ncbi:hypothetical protein SDC9_75452 [bioreactor metagenome]|uniref:Uncharacterized protein n=1 Tax=bioreactor metagenome TaxID=1076179 RepID=A0A644YS72_9ZZZZ
MLFKQHGKIVLHVVDRPCSFIERRENRDQNIGVMLYIVKVKTVLVVAGVQGFVVVQFVLQVGFHSGIDGFGGQNVRVLGLIGRRDDAAARAAEDGCTGLQAADQQRHDKQDGKNDQDAFPMPYNK